MILGNGGNGPEKCVGNLITITDLTILIFSGLGLDDLGTGHHHHQHSHAAGHFQAEKFDLLEAVGLFGNIGNFSVRHHGVVLRPGPVVHRSLCKLSCLK